MQMEQLKKSIKDIMKKKVEKEKETSNSEKVVVIKNVARVLYCCNVFSLRFIVASYFLMFMSFFRFTF